MKPLTQILFEYHQAHFEPEKYGNKTEDEEENINPFILKGQKKANTYRKFGKGLYKRQ